MALTATCSLHDLIYAPEGREDNDQAEIGCRDHIASIISHVGRDPQRPQPLYAELTDQPACLAMLIE